jgi:hypothetical protein
MTQQTETRPTTIVTDADIYAAKLYLQGTGPWALNEIGIGPDDSLVQAFARQRQHAYEQGFYDGRACDMGQPQTDALKVAALVEASEGLKQDLLNRAEWDDDAKAVCAGAGAWFRFTEALAALKESK